MNRALLYTVIIMFAFTILAVTPAAAKFCSNCGHKVGDTAKFCSNCGFKLTPATGSPKESVPAPGTKAPRPAAPKKATSVDTVSGATRKQPSNVSQPAPGIPGGGNPFAPKKPAVLKKVSDAEANTLAKKTVAAYVDYVNWIYQTKLNGEQKKEMEKALAHLYKTDAEIQRAMPTFTQDWRRNKAQVMKQGTAARNLVRIMCVHEFRKEYMDKETEPGYRIIYELDSDKYPVVVQCNPPLTESALNGFINLVKMAFAEMGRPIQPQQLQTMRQNFIDKYALCPIQQRQQFSRMDIFWAQLQAQLEQLPPAQRVQFKHAIAQQFMAQISGGTNAAQGQGVPQPNPFGGQGVPQPNPFGGQGVPQPNPFGGQGVPQPNPFGGQGGSAY